MDDDKQLLDGDELPRISTGNAGLDDILGGGIDPERMYLFEGQPGSGKTTLALEFLLEGVRAGEPTLYITLSETERELRLVAKRHGWSLNGITIFELIPPETTLDPSQELTVLHPAEMELSETTQMIFDRVEALAPARIVLDSLSELRLLAQSPLRYRRQILALKHFFSGRKSTVVLLDDLSSQQNDLQLHSIAHGVVLLEQLAIDYGAQRRRLRVVKMRGIDFKGGFHDFTIRHGGLKVYPRLVAAEHHKDFDTDVVLSGNAELDALLGGGLERGTNALLIGCSGRWKIIPGAYLRDRSRIAERALRDFCLRRRARHHECAREDVGPSASGGPRQRPDRLSSKSTLLKWRLASLPTPCGEA